LIYLTVITLNAIFLGQGPVILSAALSALIWNFLFIPPKFTFFIGKVEDLMMFIMYFITALITGNLTSRIRQKELALRSREKYISQLYEISNKINSSIDIDEIIRYSVLFMDRFLNAKTMFFLTDERNSLNLNPHKESSFVLTEKDLDIVRWCFEHKKNAGRFTDTLPLSDVHFLPLTGISGIYGVAGLVISDKKILKLEDENFINNIVRIIAGTIERSLLIKKMQEIKINEESDRLYKIIINSISHELRTPLTSLTNAAAGLCDEKMFKDRNIRNILFDDIAESSDRMNRIIGNLLDMVRLETGKLKLKLEWNDINDIVNEALNKIKRKLINTVFVKENPDNLPLLFADFSLIELVLTNLILNAVQHNVDGIKVILSIKNRENRIYFSVIDNGIGIPQNELDRIFDKFYRIPGSKTGGTGLGLSICRSIIELHNGKIYAGNNSGKGAAFTFYIPYSIPEIREAE